MRKIILYSAFLLTLNCSSLNFETGSTTKILLFSFNSKNDKKNYYENIKKIHTRNINKDKDIIFSNNGSDDYNRANLDNKINISDDLMDDIIFKVYQTNNNVVLKGIKLFARNKMINNLLNYDDKDFMKEIGFCRSQLKHMSYDLDDDGKLNQSTNVDECILGKKRYQLDCNGNWRMNEFSFTELEDWYGDNFADAMMSFLNSCKFLSSTGASSRSISIGTTVQWAKLCNIANKYQEAGISRSFFERYFTPFKVQDLKKDNSSEGLFTGYFLWEINVSREKNEKYWYPVLSMDENCKKYKNCYSREQINQGAIDYNKYAIAWTDNVFDLYNMQVQGSGVGIFEDGSKIFLGFAGKNDMPFRSYSEVIKRKDFNKTYCGNYRNIFECLRNEHDLAISVTNHCESYVFFKELEDNNIFGSQGAPLSQSRSIAIDPYYTPYGMPVWIKTYLPIRDENSEKDIWLDFNRLWIAQDTGSAIKGANRADLYLGYGPKADLIAKKMKFEGEYYILIPNIMIEGVKNCKVSKK